MNASKPEPMPPLPETPERTESAVVPVEHGAPRAPSEPARGGADDSDAGNFERHDTIPAPTWLGDGPEGELLEGELTPLRAVAVHL